jgi:hypothetical protein
MAAPPFGQTILLVGMVKAQKAQGQWAAATNPVMLVRQELCVSGNMHND